MAGSRGQKCSWKEQLRLSKEVLPALEEGEGSKYAELRCVDPATVSNWRRAAEVLEILEDASIRVTEFEHCQPTHTTVIAESFRLLRPWDDDAKEAIVELIEQCESEEITAKDLRRIAKERAWELKGVKEKKTRKKKSLPDDAFEVLLVDPPWRYDFSATDCREVENQYPTEDVDSLLEQYPSVPAAPASVMFMWATAPKLREALRLLESWGFEYKTHAIWDKKKIGMGYWFRGRHELLLVGTRGNFSPPDEKARVASVIEAPRGKHSEKPVRVYGIIEAMFPNATRCELFQREPRKGWTGWGTDS